MNPLSIQTSARLRTIALGLTIPTLILIGCAANQERADTVVLTEEQIAMLPEDAMRGAQLWADNCIRCHNVRPPRTLSDRSWDIVMMHMRVRAHLTGEESRQILKFLQAAN